MNSRGLVWDIETSPIKTIQTKWGLYDERPIEEEIIQDFQILSVAWQWVGESKVRVLGQDDFVDYKPGVLNDRLLCEKIWELLDEADYEVAHNGDRFDMGMVTSRFIIHGFKPYAPVKQIDTKKIAKRVGRFTSNKLRDLANATGSAEKGDPGGFSTWKGCMSGDKKAWKRMKQYNKLDIPPLMDLYLLFRAWDKSGYQFNVAEGRPKACPKCGGDNMHKGMKYRATNTNLYQYYRCMDCGGMAKARLPEPRLKDERTQFTS